MNVPLKLNIGDSVWIWQLGKISHDTIWKIYVIFEHGKDTIIHYQTKGYTTLEESNEGTFWFVTREAAVAYVQRTVICANLPCPEPPSQGLVTLKEKLLKKLWG